MRGITPLPIHLPEYDPGGDLCAMVSPLVGPAGVPAAGGPERYSDRARDLFQLASRERAVIAVLPWNWDVAQADRIRLQRAHRFIRDNARAGLWTLVFHPHDSEAALTLPKTIILRTSIVRGRHGRHEHAMPWLVDGFKELGFQPAAPRLYHAVPSVGFCGALHVEHYRTPTLFRRLFRRHKNQYPLAYPHPPGLRAIALEALRATAGIECRFVERDKFMGGAVLPDGTVDTAIRTRTRAEFLDNLVHADYALCMRGAGNFSIRFSEALAAGRIPLFIDSSSVLPWPNRVDWSSVLVTVELDDLPRLGQKFLEQHRRLTAAEFLARQQRCSEFWDRFISPLGFFSTLRDELATNAFR